MGQITGETKLLGVIGDPIGHSLSPVMHNAALAAHAQRQGQTHLSYAYLPLRIAPADLKTAISGLNAMEWQGFNVTIPHKQAIMTLLSQRSAIADAVGAVNTVWRTTQGWAGTNTDVHGFLAPLNAYDRDWSKAVVTLLGSGGAARAVIVACNQLGCPKIQIVGRNSSKLAQLKQSFQSTALTVHIQTHQWSHLPELLPETGLLVNATPIGMAPQINDSPLSEAALGLLPDTAIVYDLIYTPHPTKLLHDAQTQNLLNLGGLEMLIQQGAAALEIWLGESVVDVDVMRQAAQRHLANG